MLRAIASGIVALGLTVAGPVAAQERQSPEMPVLVSADKVDHDRERGLVIASGNVEIAQGERILLADTVTLNQRTDTVVASGNVSLLEPTGEVIFADFVKLQDEMGSGVMRNLRMLFPDDSRLAAAGARRTVGVETDMRKAVFSPCKLCEDKPRRPPLWQIKAVKVIHDEKGRNIEYYDAFLEMFGVPVAYTPYLSHPDPTVDRRSGILAPRMGSSTQLGFIFGVPYYVDIAPDKDATLEPIITSEEGPVFFGEYRQRLSNGSLEFSGSITRANRVDSPGVVKEDKIRGHIEGYGRFDIDDTWRLGFDVARASDDTYLRRYDFGSQDVLTSRGFVEGFRKRNYAAVNAYAFQGLRARDVGERTPLILPLIDYNFVGRPTWRGSYWTLDANLMSLTREEGPDSRRLSFKGGWHFPYTGLTGHVFDLSVRSQADVYFVNDVPDPGGPGGSTFDGVTGRFFPQATLNWRYPLVREAGAMRQLVEPVAAIILGPNGGNPDDIPNEDSQAFEYDDTDLFSANRFTGLDRVEGGQRLDYGLAMGVYGAGGGSTTAFLGQSLRFRDDSLFPTGSGLEDQLSDLVGRVHVRPGTGLDLLYRFRFDKDDLSARRNELTLNVGPPVFNLNLDYFFIDRRIGTGGFSDREEITLSAHSRLSQYWSASAHGRRDLTGDGGMLSAGFGVVYEDECFRLSGTYRRTFTRDREIEPSDTILFRLIFKHLGEFQV